MAVYTDIPDQELRNFIAGYNLGRLTSCKGIAEGVENSNFLLHTDRGSFILTLFEKRVAEKDLPYFIGLMDHCHQRHFPCPQPIENKRGQKISHLAGKPATIVTFLEGIWPKSPEPFHCSALGHAMALFHEAAKDFPLQRENALTLPGWVVMVKSLLPDAHRVDPSLPALLEDEINFLQNHWPTNLPKGNIHADLFPDNVFFLDREISGFIDFYFCCTDFLVYDLAVAVNAWCFNRDFIFDSEKARLLMDSYCQLRPLQNMEKASMSTLLRGAALRFLLTRAHDWLHPDPTALVSPKNPHEYIQKLKFFRTQDQKELFP